MRLLDPLQVSLVLIRMFLGVITRVLRPPRTENTHMELTIISLWSLIHTCTYACTQSKTHTHKSSPASMLDVYSLNTTRRVSQCVTIYNNFFFRKSFREKKFNLIKPAKAGCLEERPKAKTIYQEAQKASMLLSPQPSWTSSRLLI